jgi:hypothetical protein
VFSVVGDVLVDSEVFVVTSSISRMCLCKSTLSVQEITTFVLSVVGDILVDNEVLMVTSSISRIYLYKSTSLVQEVTDLNNPKFI